MAARSLYICRPLVNADEFIEWAKGQGFPTAQLPGDMHVTVAYSKTPLEWPALDTDTIKVGGGYERTVEALGDKGAVVLRFDDDRLQKRWGALKDQGASWDFPSYKPHVTVTWNGADVDLNEVEPYDGPLVFGPEVAKEIEEGWMDTHIEKFDPDQERDEHGRWSGGGGAGGGGHGGHGGHGGEHHHGSWDHYDVTSGGRADAAVRDFQSLQRASDDHILHMARTVGVPQVAIDQATEDKDIKGLVHDIVRAGYGEETYRETRRQVLGFRYPRTNTEKFQKAEGDVAVVKVDADLGLVFGFAIVSKINGEDYFDVQDDHIPEYAMLKAATDFMSDSRMAKEMHFGDEVGKIIFAWPLTSDIAKAFGIETDTTGLMIGMRPNNPSMLDKFRNGTFTGFSIGGSRVTDEDVAA